MTVHNYGEGKCFASVHCEVPAERDILISHDIIDNIERDFETELGIHLVIHLDPVVTEDERTNKLREQVRSLLRAVVPGASMHDFRVVWGVTHSNIVFDVAVPFSLQESDQQLKARIDRPCAPWTLPTARCSPLTGNPPLTSWKAERRKRKAPPLWAVPFGFFPSSILHEELLIPHDKGVERPDFLHVLGLALFVVVQQLHQLRRDEELLAMPLVKAAFTLL